MEVFLECCMTLFFSAAMLLLIVRLAKGEEKNMMFARVFSLRPTSVSGLELSASLC